MPKNEELEPLTNPKMVERYLRYAVDLRELTSCYLESAQLRFEGFVTSFDPSTLAIQLDITSEAFAPISLEDLRALDSPDAKLRLSFSVNDVLFFLHTRCQGRLVNRLELAVDLPLYKLQRREALRIKVMHAHGASLELNGKNYAPYDISAAGMSIWVDLETMDTFAKSQVYEGARLKFLGKEIVSKLEVISISRLKKDDDRHWKVGFRFLELPQAAEQALAKEAYLHTHRIWSRWI